MTERVLVLAPHPDDESIGPGGTLRKHVERGDAVHVVFLTSGEKGGHGRSKADTIRVREAEARAATRILGVASIEFWHFPDGGLRAGLREVERLDHLISRLKPAVIYAPHEREQHRDHQAAARLVVASSREPGVQVLMFEVWTPIQRIDHVEDISGQIEVKLRAIRAYASQCDVLGFPEAFEGLARYRGEMHSWPGGDYAEVFTLPKAR